MLKNNEMKKDCTGELLGFISYEGALLEELLFMFENSYRLIDGDETLQGCFEAIRKQLSEKNLLPPAERYTGLKVAVFGEKTKM